MNFYLMLISVKSEILRSFSSVVHQMHNFNWMPPFVSVQWSKATRLSTGIMLISVLQLPHPRSVHTQHQWHGDASQVPVNTSGHLRRRKRVKRWIVRTESWLCPNRTIGKDSCVRLRPSSRRIGEDGLKPKPNHNPKPKPKPNLRN